MQSQNLILRNDTVLGVCEAIGRDFGFHPNWLRLALSGGFFFNPVGVAAIYLALGVPVAVSRWIYPVRSSQDLNSLAPRAPEAPEAPQAPSAPLPPVAPEALEVQVPLAA
ncbi:PspC domain-containing protein [Sphingomonas piscis]|uniref:PspC domain-containing protein n=1 Tax=Sphingomonas piscis TaxID=2714943 RepID=A0A6G7YSK5_9SPHN|nr:PspC domain-containing protein [Sphingomonas piscis]QIK79720.1 PspC domain-containing protein [Sphingomonas piscis]